MENIEQNPPMEVRSQAEDVSLPVYTAAIGLHKTLQPLLGDASLDQVVHDLAETLHMEAIHPMENSQYTLLVTQSRQLDALFTRLVLKAHYNEDDPECLSIDSIQAALKVQRQCRTTIEALNAIRGTRRL